MTNHSIIRTEERAHLGEQSAKRMIDRAKEKGLDASHFPARERKYIKSKESEGKHAVYHAGYCFIFSKEDNCITMYSVPKWFGKKMHYRGKERIRHVKRYVKNHPELFVEEEITRLG